jgi:ABC-type branched-subunit amino acid transport system ATPase component
MQTIQEQISMIRDLPTQTLLLRSSGISKKFGGQTVLDNVDVELGCGEIVLLKGDNGSGKTTLLNILTANIEPDAGRLEFLMNGKEKVFEFPRLWTHNLNPFDRFTPERVAQLGVGRTWQDVRLSLTQSLRDNIAVAKPHQLGENPLLSILRPLKTIEQERRNLNYAAAVLAELGLAGREMSSADKISLGQSKRVAIARAIRAGAKILFLDEPLAGLDYDGMDKIMELLQKIAKEEGVTLVIIEHIFNIPRVLKLATKVWTLEKGRLIVDTPSCVAAEISQAPDNSIQDWLRGLAGKHGKIVIQKLGGGAILSTVIPEGQAENETVLEVKDLVVHQGKRLVIGQQVEDKQITGLSLSLQRGHLSILQAPNGWGKTTLLDTIAGILTPTRGKIYLNRELIHTSTVWRRVKKGLSYLRSQNQSFSRLTVSEMLSLSQVFDIPDRIELIKSKYLSSLSGGERQRVIIASYGANKSSLFMMDEPFSALDSRTVETFRKTIRLSKETSYFIAIPKTNQEEYL